MCKVNAGGNAHPAYKSENLFGKRDLKFRGKIYLWNPHPHTHPPPSFLLKISEYKKYDKAAISVSANTTPSPEMNDDIRGRVSARCMHNTATGPTVMDAVRPTDAPSQISENILQRNKLFSNVGLSDNVFFCLLKRKPSFHKAE